MSARLLVRKRVRRRVLEVADEWRIDRRRIPSRLLDDLAADFDKHLTQRVLAELEKAK